MEKHVTETGNDSNESGDFAGRKGLPVNNEAVSLNVGPPLTHRATLTMSKCQHHQLTWKA